MTTYETVIGLEVHAQLLTRSKLFCGCSTTFGEEPNANVCPVCSGQPGVLPVLNRRAVEYACKMALAVDCTVNPFSIFARKNYFYPDLPKGYQISQYELPLAEHGALEITVNGKTKTVGILRIHMEDDAGKNIHSQVENVSFVDLNRSGVPLIEIVSQPDMRSPEEAVAYLKALRSILVYLGICDGNMEEGSFRCDANVSIRPLGQKEYGTRAELKNLNSFRHVQRALEYEIQRQKEVIEDGERVVQETRLYDANKNITLSMRGKEEAHDYRYFPDPDLPPVIVDPAWLEAWRAELPELPLQREERFIREYGLPPQDAHNLTAERDLADYFEAAVASCNQPKLVANWMLGELLRELNQRGHTAASCPFRPESLAGLCQLVEQGVISGKIGKQIFGELYESDKDPKVFVREKGLVQISDSDAIEAAVLEVLEQSPDEVAAYKGGKTKLMGFFVGQVMKKTKGKANPGLVNQILQQKLDA